MTRFYVADIPSLAVAFEQGDDIVVLVGQDVDARRAEAVTTAVALAEDRRDCRRRREALRRRAWQVAAYATVVAAVIVAPIPSPL